MASACSDWDEIDGAKSTSRCVVIAHGGSAAWSWAAVLVEVSSVDAWPRRLAMTAFTLRDGAHAAATREAPSATSVEAMMARVKILGALEALPTMARPAHSTRARRTPSSSSTPRNWLMINRLFFQQVLKRLFWGKAVERLKNICCYFVPCAISRD